MTHIAPSPVLPDAPSGDDLLARFAQVRGTTEALAAPLGPEDQTVQSMPDVSPTKWHRAHTTWFFETFLLSPHLPGYTVYDPAYTYLFNSYYEAVGAKHPRIARGLLSRPTIEEVGAYRAHVDEAMADLLALYPDARDPDDRDSDETVAGLVVLGLNHEQQHQELLLMDIKHVLSRNPLHPAYCSGCDDQTARAEADAPTPMSWIDRPGGIVEIGHSGGGFAYDNENPRHEALLRPHRIADRPVTNGDWLAFLGDGGYHRPELWLSDGWATICERVWEAPLYWLLIDGTWHEHTLTGYRPVRPTEPVVHLSLYEADAYARWAGARLPTEQEWETAVAEHSGPTPGDRGVAGTFLEGRTFHPVPAGRPDGTARQAFGDVWEWTASPYVGYPGFAPAAGAVGEYNGKFMSGQSVLRGGCCATPAGHIRSTYRNFFPPSARWAFSGLRLAADA